MGNFKEIEIGCINDKMSIRGGPNLLLGRTSFSGMLKVVMSEPPFRDQPYCLANGANNAAYKKHTKLQHYITNPIDSNEVN